jgi:integrase
MRARGDGGLFELGDGRWRAVVELGYRDGKRQRRTWTCATRRAAAAKLKAATRLQEDGVAIPDQRLTVGAFLDRWLRESAQPTLKESAWIAYERVVRVHLVPAFGSKPLAKLDPLDLQKLYREKLESGLAPSSVLYIHRIAHRALGQAERWRLVPRSVAALVDPPRVPRTRVGAFTVEQARAFLEAVKGDKREALYILALAGGLRRGELLALRWEDVNLDAGSLAVSRSLSKVRGGWAVAEPKTASSRRVVKLPEFAAEALRVHRKRQVEERVKAKIWIDAGLVFASEAGTALDGRNVLRLFKLRIAAAGMDPAAFTFHSLRHSAATLMLALGISPKIVAEALGHSRIAVTMDTYSHVLPTLQDDAARKMDGLLAAL